MGSHATSKLMGYGLSLGAFGLLLLGVPSGFCTRILTPPPESDSQLHIGSSDAFSSSAFVATKPKVFLPKLI
jgi:hypothetical protein